MNEETQQHEEQPTLPTRPSWERTRAELNVDRLPNGIIDYDGYRRKKLKAVAEMTGRPIIVYATDFLNQRKSTLANNEIAIDHNDLQGFAEVTKYLPNGAIDIILHSPGGSPDAADSIVDFLRNRFTDIRFIIPTMAKSAATMIALSGDKILMPFSAELGPIDPQMLVPDGAGGRMHVPAKALTKQFEDAVKSISENPRTAFAWEPILRIYSPALYVRCQNAIQLSKDLVIEWMQKWMFKDLDASVSKQKAEEIADYLAEHDNFLSHGKRVSFSDLVEKGVKVENIEEQPDLWLAVEDAWYAVVHTFENTGAFKLYENSDGQTWVRLLQQQPVMIRQN